METPLPTESSTPAVIYCRVSSDRQAKEGGGLQSQEQRCRSYAQGRGYEVIGVFSDDGVSGALLARAGISTMLSFLKKKKRRTVVLIDDISRIARDVKTHIELRAVIAANDGVLESPSMRFEDTAAGEFIELVLAASAQFGRKGNREQVLHRQKARLQLGYWSFAAPPGYAYQRDPVHKKLLVPTEAARSLLGPALQAFAEKRIGSQRALALHLCEGGFYASDGKASIGVLEKRITRILDALSFYAGFIAYPKWEVEPVRGHHEPIISAQTLAQLQDRLAAPAPISPERRDERADFPLRNFIRCPECRRPLTGCLAKGKYPRYFCYAQGRCSRYGWSTSAKILEPAFQDLLCQAAPSHEVWEAVRILATAAWKRRLENWSFEARHLQKERQKKGEEIRNLISRLAKTSDDEIAVEFEKAVRVLKSECARLDANLEKYCQTPPDFETAFERVSTLIRTPHLLWRNGDLNEKRRVHRLVFTDAPTFDRKEGFSTFELTLPYLISSQVAASDSRLVESTGESWHKFFDFVLTCDALNQPI